MANWTSILASIRFALGRLTDLLLAGRSAGYWEKGQGPEIKPDYLKSDPDCPTARPLPERSRGKS